MNIVYIHGNRATVDSFNFFRTQLAEYRDVVLEYDGADGFYNNHQAMLERLRGLKDLLFVGHSLGGIHALHLANELQDNVVGGVTLSTPYGGSEAAEVVKYLLPFNQVLQDIHPRSAPILDSNAIEILHPWTNIVSTKGHSMFMMSANDGVVTQNSMRHRDDMQLVEVESNHFEILLSYQAVNIIRKTIAELEHGLQRRIVVCTWD